jgi:hypothetical protein
MVISLYAVATPDQQGTVRASRLCWRAEPAAVISSSMTRLNGHAKFDDRYAKPMHGTVVFFAAGCGFAHGHAVKALLTGQACIRGTRLPGQARFRECAPAWLMGSSPTQTVAAR